MLNQENFDRLLEWLHPDREEAGRKYKIIHTRLIKFFMCRGCAQAEEMADDTINRVCRKAKEIVPSYEGDPALYFYGVAKKIYFEHTHKNSSPTKALSPSVAAVETSDELEREFACLERCMQQLKPDNRELVLQYYQDEKSAKIDHRKELAVQLGIALNALRIRAHRIRASLYECILKCLEQQTSASINEQQMKRSGS
jgi:DNA-directed RNA polymerase specialized sigma24 family protein